MTELWERNLRFDLERAAHRLDLVASDINAKTEEVMTKLGLTNRERREIGWFTKENELILHETADKIRATVV